MHIVVCIKQVPDTTDVKINPETNTLVREGVVSIVNPFDMYAIEEAIRIKEMVGGDSTVTALTMGPPQAEAVLREAIAMGVDKGVLLEMSEQPSSGWVKVRHKDGQSGYVKTSEVWGL